MGQKINDSQTNTEVDVTSTKSYIKYDNGMIIQTVKRAYTVAISTLWNGIRISGNISSVNWPVAFTSVSSITHTANTSGSDSNVWYMSGAKYSLTGTGDSYIVSAENITSSKAYEVHSIAIGQWK